MDAEKTNAEQCDCCELSDVEVDKKSGSLGGDKDATKVLTQQVSSGAKNQPLTSIIVQLQKDLQDMKEQIKQYEDLKHKHAELQLELDITKSQLQRFQRNEMDLLAVRRQIALENLRRHHYENAETDYPDYAVCRCPGSETLLDDLEEDYDTID